MLAYKLREWINPDKINWAGLSTNPAAISLLEANPDKISWYALLHNPAAIRFLEDFQNKAQNSNTHVWYALSQNPAIFRYDYDQMRTNNLILNRELTEYVYHPDRVERLLE